MSSLSRYGKNAADRTYPDKDESVLGHMVLELGMSSEDAVQNLRPWVRDLDRTAANSKNVAYMSAFIGAGAGLATAATVGIGLTAILPIAAAVYNYFIAQQSAQEQSIREAEYLLLKSCPELLKLIYALAKRGMPKEALIECYDDLLGAFTHQYQQRASLGMSSELDHDIVRTFEQIVKAKIEAENLGRSIVAETQDFTFDTLYQSTEPTAPRVETPKYQPSPNTQLAAIDTPAQKQADQPFVLPIASPESKLFDWNLLNTHYDDYPHLFLLGKTGAGKSYLAERLGRFLNGSTLVITPKKKPKDFIGMQVIGLPYDFHAIAANLEGLTTLVKQREDQMNRTGKDDFMPVNVILDEVPTFVSGCKDLGLDVVKDLKFIIRAGRTSKIRLILLAQGSEVKTLGIEGEGSLRDNLSYVYLKGFAEAQSKEWALDISKYDRPCLIDGKVADISQLVSLASEATPSEIIEHKPIATAQDLERLYNAPSAEPQLDIDSDTADEVTSYRTMITETFPQWKPQSVELATRIVDWMAARSDKSFKPNDVKQSIRKLKDDSRFTTDRIKDLLDSLVKAQILSEADGKYSIADYDF
ncbi:hypothetical protein H6F51_21465 [Cyanobacteria bacterium FACHB-DQ100]|nr:hypothetical protein [Cyanobacteria bacterium FACHB-DQ100]